MKRIILESSKILCIMHLLLPSGCAAIVIAGASGAIAYTITNVAYKTMSYPFSQVKQAADAALKNMGVKEIGKKDIENGVLLLWASYPFRPFSSLQDKPRRIFH